MQIPNVTVNLLSEHILTMHFFISYFVLVNRDQFEPNILQLYIGRYLATKMAAQIMIKNDKSGCFLGQGSNKAKSTAYFYLLQQ